MKIKTRYLIQLGVIITCIFLAYFYLIYSSDIVRMVRSRCRDFLYQISSGINPPAEYKDKLVILAIDEESLSLLGLQFPLKRSYFAEILKQLREYEPRITFLNFLLAWEIGGEESDDLILAAAMGKSGKVVLPSYYDVVGNRIGPLNIFEEEAYKVGYINKIRDWDSAIRRCKLSHLSKEGKLDEYALELQIASEWKGKKEEDVIFKTPLQKDGSIYINYRIRPEQLRVVSLADFMQGKVDTDYFKNKIVLVADVSEIGGSMYNTPLGVMPGIYVIANELIMLLSERYINPPDLGGQMALAFLLMIGTGVITFRFNMGKGALVTFLSGIAIFIFSLLGFQKGFLIDYFSLVFPMCGIFIFAGFFRYLVLLEDKIDELKEANIKIQEAQEEIIKREQLSTIGRMTAKILHEIKSPLANIKSCFDSIKAGVKEDPRSRRTVQLAGDEVNRMVELSKQLRETYTPYLEDVREVDINTILRDAIEISRKRFYDKGVEIRMELAKELPMVKVSPSKIKQVFINILNNAFEAVGPGGRVEIGSQIITLPDRRNISIIFKDSGCGIPPEDLPKIFDIFYSTKKEIQGSGLGLFICKEILKAHRGDITVNSALGEGTTFTVSLPISL